MKHMFEEGLERREANYVPLTPIDFIVRAAEVYGERPAVVHGEIRRNWRETYERARRLASALRQAGIERGDTVAALLPNIPPMIEAHFGVPMAGAVLNTLNTRLDVSSLLFMLRHGEAKALIVDTEYGEFAHRAALEFPDLRVISVADAMPADPAQFIRATDYEAFLQSGDPAIRVDAARRRMGRDRAELHLGHDRRSEGRGLPPSRRVSECAQQYPRMGHAQARGLPVDPAAVPLQRLVFSVDRCRACRRQRLLAQIRCEDGVRSDSPRRHHALLRRADRAERARQRAGRMARGHRASRVDDGGGRGARAGGDREDEGDRLRSDARVRTDRNLRAGRGLRETGGVGDARRQRARRTERAARRALSPAGGGDRARSGHARSPCPTMARRSARSCSAATSA